MKTIGWRKLAFGALVVVSAYGFIFWKTQVVGAELVVPDVPSNVRDIVLGVFFAFVGGNVAGKFAKAKGSSEAS